MSEMPWEDGPWMPTVPSAEDEYLSSLEPDPLDVLTERQRFVVELRFGLRDGICYTQREIAQLMGVDRKTVWEHEKAAKKKLEREVGKPPQWIPANV